MDSSKKVVASAMRQMKSDDDTAKDFIERVKESKDTFNRVYDKFYKQYQIDGKTMPEWQEHFKVVIPKDCDVTKCKEILSRLGTLYHEASYYYSRSNALDKAYNSEREKEYRKEYKRTATEMTTDGKKLPAAGTLSALASEKVQEFDDVIYNSQLTKDFWNSIIKELQYTFKLVNDMTINNSLELKISSPS